jgi:hypothetical protein
MIVIAAFPGGIEGGERLNFAVLACEVTYHV